MVTSGSQTATIQGPLQRHRSPTLLLPYPLYYYLSSTYITE
jgi:hypothetical protein